MEQQAVLIDNRTGEIIKADDAWERHRRIVGLRNDIERSFLELGKELHFFHQDEQFKDLNYPTLDAYLADPVVDIGRRMAYYAISVYRHYALILESAPAALLEVGIVKAAMMIPYVTRRNMDELLASASTLSRRGLRDYLAEKFPKGKPQLPSGKYRIIYADPPWQYGNTMPEYFTEQADHYDLMTLEEICALPVKELVADAAVLFLWATSPILEEAFQVVHAWGFEYKTSFVWDKVKHCMGHYNSVRHELLLVCVRGSCMPDEPTLFDSVVTEERSDRHSEKPEVFRGFIDALYTWGSRIELFSRKQVKGWDVWGNEVPGFAGS